MAGAPPPPDRVFMTAPANSQLISRPVDSIDTTVLPFSRVEIALSLSLEPKNQKLRAEGLPLDTASVNAIDLAENWIVSEEGRGVYSEKGVEERNINLGKTKPPPTFITEIGVWPKLLKAKGFDMILWDYSNRVKKDEDTLKNSFDPPRDITFEVLDVLPVVHRISPDIDVVVLPGYSRITDTLLKRELFFSPPAPRKDEGLSKPLTLVSFKVKAEHTWPPVKSNLSKIQLDVVIDSESGLFVERRLRCVPFMELVNPTNPILSVDQLKGSVLHCDPEMSVCLQLSHINDHIFDELNRTCFTPLVWACLDESFRDRRSAFRRNDLINRTREALDIKLKELQERITGGWVDYMIDPTDPTQRVDPALLTTAHPLVNSRTVIPTSEITTSELSDLMRHRGFAFPKDVKFEGNSIIHLEDLVDGHQLIKGAWLVVIQLSMVEFDSLFDNEDQDGENEVFEDLCHLVPLKLVAIRVSADLANSGAGGVWKTTVDAATPFFADTVNLNAINRLAIKMVEEPGLVSFNSRVVTQVYNAAPTLPLPRNVANVKILNFHPIGMPLHPEESKMERIFDFKYKSPGYERDIHFRVNKWMGALGAFLRINGFTLSTTLEMRVWLSEILKWQSISEPMSLTTLAEIAGDVRTVLGCLRKESFTSNTGIFMKRKTFTPWAVEPSSQILEVVRGFVNNALHFNSNVLFHQKVEIYPYTPLAPPSYSAFNIREQLVAPEAGLWFTFEPLKMGLLRLAAKASGESLKLPPPPTLLKTVVDITRGLTVNLSALQCNQLANFIAVALGNSVIIEADLLRLSKQETVDSFDNYFSARIEELVKELEGSVLGNGFVRVESALPANQFKLGFSYVAGAVVLLVTLRINAVNGVWECTCSATIPVDWVAPLPPVILSVETREFSTAFIWRIFGAAQLIKGWRKLGGFAAIPAPAALTLLQMPLFDKTDAAIASTEPWIPDVLADQQTVPFITSEKLSSRPWITTETHGRLALRVILEAMNAESFFLRGHTQDQIPQGLTVTRRPVSLKIVETPNFIFDTDNSGLVFTQIQPSTPLPSTVWAFELSGDDVEGENKVGSSPLFALVFAFLFEPLARDLEIAVRVNINEMPTRMTALKTAEDELELAEENLDKGRVQAVVTPLVVTAADVAILEGEATAKTVARNAAQRAVNLLKSEIKTRIRAQSKLVDTLFDRRHLETRILEMMNALLMSTSISNWSDTVIPQIYNRVFLPCGIYVEDLNRWNFPLARGLINLMIIATRMGVNIYLVCPHPRAHDSHMVIPLLPSGSRVVWLMLSKCEEGFKWKVLSGTENSLTDPEKIISGRTADDPKPMTIWQYVGLQSRRIEPQMFVGSRAAFDIRATLTDVLWINLRRHLDVDRKLPVRYNETLEISYRIYPGSLTSPSRDVLHYWFRFDNTNPANPIITGPLDLEWIDIPVGTKVECIDMAPNDLKARVDEEEELFKSKAFSLTGMARFVSELAGIHRTAKNKNANPTVLTWTGDSQKWAEDLITVITGIFDSLEILFNPATVSAARLALIDNDQTLPCYLRMIYIRDTHQWNPLLVASNYAWLFDYLKVNRVAKIELIQWLTKSRSAADKFFALKWLTFLVWISSYGNLQTFIDDRAGVIDAVNTRTHRHNIDPAVINSVDSEFNIACGNDLIDLTTVVPVSKGNRHIYLSSLLVMWPSINSTTLPGRNLAQRLENVLWPMIFDRFTKVKNTPALPTIPLIISQTETVTVGGAALAVAGFVPIPLVLYQDYFDKVGDEPQLNGTELWPWFLAMTGRVFVNPTGISLMQKCMYTGVKDLPFATTKSLLGELLVAGWYDVLIASAAPGAVALTDAEKLEIKTWIESIHPPDYFKTYLTILGNQLSVIPVPADFFDSMGTVTLLVASGLYSSMLVGAPGAGVGGGGVVPAVAGPVAAPVPLPFPLDLTKYALHPDAQRRFTEIETAVRDLSTNLGLVNRNVGDLAAAQVKAVDLVAITDTVTRENQTTRDLFELKITEVTDEHATSEVAIKDIERKVDDLDARFDELELKVEDSKTVFEKNTEDLIKEIDDLMKNGIDDIKAENTTILTDQAKKADEIIDKIQNELTESTLDLKKESDDIKIELDAVKVTAADLATAAGDIRGEMATLAGTVPKIEDALATVTDEIKTSLDNVEKKITDEVTELTRVVDQLKVSVLDNQRAVAALTKIVNETLITEVKKALEDVLGGENIGTVLKGLVETVTLSSPAAAPAAVVIHNPASNSKAEEFINHFEARIRGAVHELRLEIEEVVRDFKAYLVALIPDRVKLSKKSLTDVRVFESKGFDESLEGVVQNLGRSYHSDRWRYSWLGFLIKNEIFNNYPESDLAEVMKNYHTVFVKLNDLTKGIEALVKISREVALWNYYSRWLFWREGYKKGVVPQYTDVSHISPLIDTPNDYFVQSLSPAVPDVSLLLSKDDFPKDRPQFSIKTLAAETILAGMDFHIASSPSSFGLGSVFPWLLSSFLDSTLHKLDGTSLPSIYNYLAFNEAERTKRFPNNLEYPFTVTDAQVSAFLNSKEPQVVELFYRLRREICYLVLQDPGNFDSIVYFVKKWRADTLQDRLLEMQFAEYKIFGTGIWVFVFVYMGWMDAETVSGKTFDGFDGLVKLLVVDNGIDAIQVKSFNQARAIAKETLVNRHLDAWKTPYMWFPDIEFEVRSIDARTLDDIKEEPVEMIVKTLVVPFEHILPAIWIKKNTPLSEISNLVARSEIRAEKIVKDTATRWGITVDPQVVISCWGVPPPLLQKIFERNSRVFRKLYFSKRDRVYIIFKDDANADYNTDAERTNDLQKFVGILVSDYK